MGDAMIENNMSVPHAQMALLLDVAIPITPDELRPPYAARSARKPVTSTFRHPDRGVPFARR